MKNNNQSKNYSTQLMNLEAEVKFYKDHNISLKENIRNLQGKAQ